MLSCDRVDDRNKPQVQDGDRRVDGVEIGYQWSQNERANETAYVLSFGRIRSLNQPLITHEMKPRVE